MIKKEECYLQIADEIALWIRSRVVAANVSGVVLGLSGGIDSAVVAALAKKALPKFQILAIALPCQSETQDFLDANELAHQINIPFLNFDLTNFFKSFDQALYTATLKKNSIAKANLKSRLRMATLYYFANAHNYLVLGTSNKSEMLLGYFTKYGDGGVDLEPIGDLYKTEIFELAKVLGIPKTILNKAPSAGLWEGQTDEQELGSPYAEIDPILEAVFESSKDQSTILTEEKQIRFIKMVQACAHKRMLPPIFSIDRSKFNV